MDGHNFEKLAGHIVSLSHAKSFHVAKLEWTIKFVEISEEKGNCPCGQTILEHCYISNHVNGNETYVGNVCINRFMEIDTGSLFDGLKRIAENNRANANIAVIEYANERGFLFEREYPFLIQTRLKQKLSAGQLAWKEKINKRILKQAVVKRRSK
jgi:hypothetical protein